MTISISASTLRRARYPDAAGFVERAGVRVAWERFGTADQAVLLMPSWEVGHSRAWKFQIPYLARAFTVVVFDRRGNGRSDRPQDIAAYDRSEGTSDAVAVLDAVGVERATVVSWCGAGDDVALAVDHPGRVDSLVLIAPDLLLTETPNEDLYEHLQDWPGFLESFYSKLFSEPHSSKQIEDSVAWGLETDAATIERGLAARWDNGEPEARALLARVRCPTLVIQGSEDAIAGPARGPAIAAAIPNAELVTFEGSGHGPLARDPVRFNTTLLNWIERGARFSAWKRAPSRQRRALYVSSPIGLGHVRRDLAIADELRALQPDLEIDWLAQEPVTTVLRDRGERIHPMSVELANESAHMCAEASGHELACFEALRRMDEILLANFMVFYDATRAQNYDLWIGDEAWDVDYYLHENPELKTAAYVWLTDFVGYLPLPAGGEREALLTADYNAEMIEQVERYPRVRDRSIFVGEPEDIVHDTFGPTLPSIRAWTEEHFSFSGYITGFEPPDPSQLNPRRAELGWGPDERICLVAVGGSGVGSALLARVIDSFPAARRLVPRLRMIVVSGPRIDPETLPTTEGLEISGYVPDLHRHLAACDLAVVQGGLTTTMELTAAGRPFLYFPLAHHFEQRRHVHHRLQRYGAGRCMEFADSTPEVIAAAIVEELGRAVSYRAVPTDGAKRAAAVIAELL